MNMKPEIVEVNAQLRGELEEHGDMDYETMSRSVDERAEALDERAEALDERAEALDERAEALDERDGKETARPPFGCSPACNHVRADGTNQGDLPTVNNIFIILNSVEPIAPHSQPTSKTSDENAVAKEKAQPGNGVKDRISGLMGKISIGLQTISSMITIWGFLPIIPLWVLVCSALPGFDAIPPNLPHRPNQNAILTPNMSADTNAPALISAVGKPALRRDLADKLAGEARFAADVRLPGTLVGKILRSPHPHARILSVDASAALAVPGVRAAVTPFDVPPGRVAPDVPILDTKARFVGDEVAAVAADDEDTAEYALSLIKTRYEILPFVTRAEDALLPDAPRIHEGGNLAGGEAITLERGSVSDGFARADFIIEDTFSTPSHASAALEPRAAVADWDGERLTVWKSTRGVHQDRLLLALALGVPRENVRVVGVSMGAGYGGKDETRLSVLAAILARRARKPVKIEASRHEEFVAGRRRHGATTTVRMGVRRDGEITAVHAKTVMDTGAYLSSGPGVVRRAGQGALYLYRCANARYDGWLAYTNTPSGGSYRALGAPQGHFALEMIADRAAQAVGMDALDFRLKNHVGIEGQPGERTSPPNAIIDTQPVEGGVPFSSNGLRECILKGADAFGWREFAKNAEGGGPLKRGKGMAVFIYRGGPGGRSIARARLESGGAIRLISGVMDVGEGSYTALSQIAAEALGVDVERIQTTFADTAETPDSPITAGSTATFSAGLAAERAASDLKARILEAASDALGAPASHLYIEGADVRERGGSASVSLSRLAEIAGGVEVEAAVTPGSSEYVVNSFGAHFAEVEVNEDTGEVRVVRYVAAHDSGRIVNPTLALNQVEGGVSQMLGFALSEEMLTDAPSGATLNASFLEHKSPTILEYPDIQVIFADVVDPIGPYGAKALGEPPSIGVAPAVMSAIRDAIGVEVKDLPATPQRILDLLEKRERSQA